MHLNLTGNFVTATYRWSVKSPVHGFSHLIKYMQILYVLPTANLKTLDLYTKTTVTGVLFVREL
jgi:hypothetical protein